MRIERTKNASRNMVYGTALQILKLGTTFLMRIVIQRILGAQFLGLNSLFASVISVLNIAELGVGPAMVYSMYRPIIEDDSEKICALMRLYKLYYRAIGTVVCVLGLILLPFIPDLISGNAPSGINIYVLYVINLSSAVMSYWLFAYKNSLLQAHQRDDMISKVMLVTEGLKYILQFIAVVIFKNYYMYVTAILFAQLLNNVITAIISSRLYPDYHASGTLPKSEKASIDRRVKDLFTTKIATVVLYSSDNIVISAFLGLVPLATYQNYYYVFGTIATLISIVFASVRAGLGNSIIIETKEKIFSDFKVFLLIVVWLTGFCSTCLLCLYQPFIELWVGADFLMEFGMVVCLAVYFFVHCLNVFLNSYKDASGMWHEDRFRPLVEALINIVLNIILVQIIGLYGIVLSTVLSMLIVAPWLIRNLFKVILDRTYLKHFLYRIAYYTIVSALVAAVTYRICSLVALPLIPTIICRLCICLAVSNILFFLAYFKIPEFRGCLTLAERILGEKIKPLGQLIHKVNHSINRGD